MTPAEAHTLVQKIQHTWGNLPPSSQDDWLDTLERLDAGAAGTALARLRKSRTDMPTLRDLRNEYRAIDTASQHQHHNCDTCGYDGLKHYHRTDCPEPHREDCGHNCPVGPCHCPNGDQHRDAFRRLFPTTPPRPRIAPDPMRAARGVAIAASAEAAERERLKAFRVGQHLDARTTVRAPAERQHRTTR